jgi:hypothetical protein
LIETSARWPDFFIPGVDKAGTTACANLLGQHPGVFMCTPKEPHFFSQPSAQGRLSPFIPAVLDRQEYLSLFRTAPEQALWGDASTSYFWDPEAPKRIRRSVPHARFLILLRNPVERAFSHFLNNVREGIEKRDFKEAILHEQSRSRRPRSWTEDTVYLDCGFYAEGLDRYFALFGREAVMVLLFEEVIALRPAGTEQILRFLGADPLYAESLKLRPQNQFARSRVAGADRVLGSPRLRILGRKLVPHRLRSLARHVLLKTGSRPILSNGTARMLADFYREDIVRCEKLLGRSLPWGNL